MYFSWSLKVHCCVRISQTIDHYLNQVSPINILITECHFNIIFQTLPCSPMWSLRFIFSTYRYTYTYIWLLPWAKQSHSPRSEALTVAREVCKLWSCSLCTILHFFVVSTQRIHQKVITLHEFINYCFVLHWKKMYKSLKSSLCRILELPAMSGLAIAHAVSRWIPTATARVWSCGICGEQSGAWADFLRVLRFPLPIFISPIAPQSPTSITLGWYNRPVVAAVPSGHSLTSLRIIKKIPVTSYLIGQHILLSIPLSVIFSL
jgi:hypothetical protein